MWWHSTRKQGTEHCHILIFSLKTLYFSGNKVHRLGIWQTDKHTVYVSLCLCMCICTQNMTSHNTIWNVRCPGSELVNTLMCLHSVTTAAVIHDNNISLSSYLKQITNRHCSCFQDLKYGQSLCFLNCPLSCEPTLKILEASHTQHRSLYSLFYAYVSWGPFSCS